MSHKNATVHEKKITYLHQENKGGYFSHWARLIFGDMAAKWPGKINFNFDLEATHQCSS